MIDEELDIFDDGGVHAGRKARSLVHRDGDWHRTFHCWLVGQRDRRRFVVFQLRGPRASIFPNLLDITAAGHLLAGESEEQGVRELEEELGIVVEPTTLRALGTRTEAVRIGDIVNREFAETYMLRDDRPLREYRPDPAEVAGLVEVELDDGLRLFGAEVDAVDAIELRSGPHAREAQRQLRVGDVVPRRDRYYLKVCIMAARLLDGERHLAI